MHHFLKIIRIAALGYTATYAAIWLHEWGHALAYRYFGCKPDLFDLHVPFHFGAASPEPLDAACTATLGAFPLFLAAMGGIMANMVFAPAAYYLLRRMPAGGNAALLCCLFVLAHLTEAASYLTLSNIRPLGDMIAVQNYCPALRLPLGLLGLGLVLCMIHFIKSMQASWRTGLWIYVGIMTACMVGMRFLFAGA